MKDSTKEPSAEEPEEPEPRNPEDLTPEEEDQLKRLRDAHERAKEFFRRYKEQRERTR